MAEKPLLIKGRRGAGLPAALLAVLGAAILVAGTYALLRLQANETLYQARALQAQAIAEAGLEDGLNRLITARPPWDSGSYQKNYAGGYYVVSRSTDLVPWVTSIGYSSTIPRFGRASRKVQAQTLRDGFQNYASSTFTVNWMMTAFDSSVNTNPQCRINDYGTANWTSRRCIALSANVLAERVVTAAGAYRIDGNATYWEETSTAPAANTVTGSVIFGSSDTLVYGDDYPAYPGYNDNNASRITNFAQVYSTTTMALTVGPTATTLSSGTFYFSQIIVTSATLTINPGGATSGRIANIYVASSVFVSPAGRILSNCGSCMRGNVHVYGLGGGTFTISGYSSVGKSANITYLDLFAPTTPIVVQQRMLGRVVGKSVTFLYPSAYSGGLQYPLFHFDRAYGYTKASGSRWTAGTWSQGP